MTARVAITTLAGQGELGVAAMAALEALAPPFSPGQTFLIKVNLIRGEPPPRSTHPAVVESICRYLARFAPRRVWLGEGASFPGPTRTMGPIFRELGFAELAARQGVELVDLNHGPFACLPRPAGRPPFTVNSVVAQADQLISVPILKTTEPTVVTLGMKNLVGLLPGEIYGYPKSELHRRDPEMGTTVVDLVTAKRPALTVIDASTGLADLPVRPPYGLVLAGTDVVATDVVGAAVMDFEPMAIAHLAEAARRGLGEGDLRNIELCGARLDEVRRAFPYPAELVYGRGEHGRIVSPIHPTRSRSQLVGAPWAR